ncbi:MerR family transcriptional regulator [Aureimonas sp. SK2]|uniref:MerR family transcriptional regulator n=1 Tax=Aureimonas sp. SK2 TaxID=3015992 RepID=UPI002444E98F|nr:MerR family transcriptional regulator [Aureimonas sp. SK2]
MTDKSADAFRTISEAAEELDLPPHVLRFWETRFPQIKPMKRGGGRRYYRPDDVELLKGIRYLLYVRGFTIRGVQRILKESGHRAVMAIGAGDLSAFDRLQSGRAQRSEPDVLAVSAPEVEEDAIEQPVPERSRGGLSGLLRRDRDSHGGLSSDGVDRLNGVILELLELKRLLDQVR